MLGGRVGEAVAVKYSDFEGDTMKRSVLEWCEENGVDVVEE
jgi:hypothetical protein